jgi:hypothetical protein
MTLPRSLAGLSELDARTVYRSMFLASPDGLLLVDTEGIIVPPGISQAV